MTPDRPARPPSYRRCRAAAHHFRSAHCAGSPHGTLQIVELPPPTNRHDGAGRLPSSPSPTALRRRFPRRIPRSAPGPRSAGPAPPPRAPGPKVTPSSPNSSALKALPGAIPTKSAVLRPANPFTAAANPVALMIRLLYETRPKQNDPRPSSAWGRGCVSLDFTNSADRQARTTQVASSRLADA